MWGLRPEDFEPGQKWPMHPDDEYDDAEDGHDALSAIESLHELSGLDGVQPEEKPPVLDAHDMQCKRFLGFFQYTLKIFCGFGMFDPC